jgi:hypothetical protein
MKTRYYAEPCGCMFARCPDWHVQPVAAVQSVHFTQKQAEAVAELLNKMEEEESNEAED